MSNQHRQQCRGPKAHQFPLQDNGYALISRNIVYSATLQNHLHKLQGQYYSHNNKVRKPFNCTAIRLKLFIKCRLVIHNMVKSKWTVLKTVQICLLHLLLSCIKLTNGFISIWKYGRCRIRQCQLLIIYNRYFIITSYSQSATIIIYFVN